MSYSITITRVSNGFSVSETNDETGNPQTVVFEESEDFPSVVNPRTVADLLWHVAEYFNAGGSKHDPERLKISVVSQDGEELEE